MTERSYIAYDDFKDADAIHMKGYIRDVVVREKRMTEPLVGDKRLLLAALAVAVKAGTLIDLIKKLAVYGKAISSDQLADAANDVIGIGEKFFDAIYDSDVEDSEFITVNVRLLHAALGGFGEQAEMLELLVNQIETGTLDVAKVVDERGDQTWYGGLGDDELAQLLGVDVTEAINKVLVGNTNKLELRHGKAFDPNHAKNRDAEMAAVKEAL